MKPKIKFLYSDHHQITRNCFIYQIHSILKNHYILEYISLAELKEGKYQATPPNQIVFSVLLQRQWHQALPFLGRLANKGKLLLYDQDPWEAFSDKAVDTSLYSRICECIDIERFLVTSGWWSNYISITTGLPCSFVKMGVLRQNIRIGRSFEERPHELAFMGTLHPHRKAFFNQLAHQNIHVTCFPSKAYKTFLKRLDHVGAFIHSDIANITINGQNATHGLWIKAIEVAARGCFALRNVDLDMNNYQINSIPLIIPFEDSTDAVLKIQEIRSLPARTKRELQVESIRIIEQEFTWHDILEQVNLII